MESIKHMKRSIFMPFKRDRKKHWDRVYEKNLPSEVGWHQDYPEMSLKLIANTEVGADGSIIDIGWAHPNYLAYYFIRVIKD